MRARLLALVLAALPLAAAGCDGQTGTLLLAWQFSDGRTCFDAGAQLVLVRTSRDGDERKALGDLACRDGFAPTHASLDGVPESATLYLDARSGVGRAALYHGEIDLAGAPLSLPRAVTLYATGAE